MKLLENGFVKEPTATLNIDETTYEKYCNSQFRVYWDKQNDVYAMGLESNSEFVAWLGQGQETASENVIEFFKPYNERIGRE